MENISRFIESFCADLIHVVSKGNVMTPKHYLLGLGIHNMTGQKTPVQVLLFYIPLVTNGEARGHIHLLFI